MIETAQGILRQSIHHPQRKGYTDYELPPSHHHKQSSLLDLPEPLSDDTDDTNIQYEAGERPPLLNASIGSKGLPIFAPSTTHHFCVVPELFLQTCRQNKFGPTPEPAKILRQRPQSRAS
jgi:hypothetical protein